MIPFSTLRKFYRIPLISENREAVHIISNLFQLLIALFRVRRKRDFCILQNIFFMMIDSFAQYSSAEAKGTVDLMLQIPWFHSHQRDLYRAIASYNRIIEIMKVVDVNGPCIAKQEEINRYTREFVKAFKAMVDFNEKDESRVDRLLEQPKLVDVILNEIFESLGNKYIGLTCKIKAQPKAQLPLVAKSASEQSRKRFASGAGL